MKLNIGLLYLGLHNQMIKKYGVNISIPRKEFFIKIGRHSQIPKALRPIVLKEMIDKELIEMVNRDNIKLLPIEIDIEENCNELYRLAGIHD